MFQVIKRDGSKADFTLTKINDAFYCDADELQ